MKTPQQLHSELFEEHLGYVTGGFLQQRLKIIAEIQRDAREGMIPKDDIHFALGRAYCYYGSGQFQVFIDALRAKHPNLFKT